MSQKSRFCKLQISTDFNRNPHQFYHHFCIIFTSFFHSIFMYFRNPLPEGIFGGSRCQPMLQSTILRLFWIQGGSTSEHFQRKRRVKSTTPNDWVRPGVNLVAIWRQKRSEDAFVSILSRSPRKILHNFRWICDDIFINFSTPFQHQFFNVSFTKSHTTKKTKRRTTKRTVQNGKTFKGLVESALALWICSSSRWTRIWHPFGVKP